MPILIHYYIILDNYRDKIQTIHSQAKSLMDPISSKDDCPFALYWFK
jgi:hypothetical protein